MIVGLVKPDEGDVIFEGNTIANKPMHARARLGIGYLTQEPSVFRKLTVEQYILAILETCTKDIVEQRARVKSLLDELDLTSLAKSTPPATTRADQITRSGEAFLRHQRLSSVNVPRGTVNSARGCLSNASANRIFGSLHLSNGPLLEP